MCAPLAKAHCGVFLASVFALASLASSAQTVHNPGFAFTLGRASQRPRSLATSLARATFGDEGEMRMKTAIIANPEAGHGSVRARWRELNTAVAHAFGPAAVRFTQGPGDATQLARSFLREGFVRLVVLGGDGTLNEVVAGLFCERGLTFLREDVLLVALPLGTGHDFCRSLKSDWHSLKDFSSEGVLKRVDLGHARFVAADGQLTGRHFLNMASFGASGEIVRKVHATRGLNAGRVPFLWQTLTTLYRCAHAGVRLMVDDHFDEVVDINTVAIANGCYFGGALKVAPDALLSDGKFDIVIMENIGLQKFLRYSLRLHQGRHIGMPEVRVVRGSHIRAVPLEPLRPVLIDLDGEQPGRLPLDVTLLRERLTFFVPN